MPKHPARPPRPPSRAAPARPQPPARRRSFLARNGFKLAIFALLVLSLLPMRMVTWAGWFRSLTTTLAAPISHPITLMGNAVRPPERARDQRTRQQLQTELEIERLARLQTEARNARLAEQLAVLLHGAAHNPDVPIRQLPAPVVGETAGIPLVATGARAGITDGDVATTTAIHLMGRAAQTSTRTARVVPITHRDAPPIAAVVMLDDTASRTRRCLLAPAGDGTLTGDLETDDPDYPAPVEQGMTVRLADDTWPTQAQMLIVGTVTRVAKDPHSPLRQVITVKPAIELARVDEVVFRLPVAQGGTPDAGPGDTQEQRP